MKICTRCGETKPLDGGFHRRKSSRDGRNSQCKACVKAYQSEWYERPEVQAHRAEYKAEYYAENRDAIQAYKAEHYRRNRDAIRAQQAEYKAAHRETLLERRAEYHQANPHIAWEHRYLHRAKRYGFEPVIEPFTKDELIAKYGDKCAHCGGPFEELDHYPVAVIHGGTHTIENCRPSCTNCNKKTWTNTNETENTK